MIRRNFLKAMFGGAAAGPSMVKSAVNTLSHPMPEPDRPIAWGSGTLADEVALDEYIDPFEATKQILELDLPIPEFRLIDIEEQAFHRVSNNMTKTFVQPPRGAPDWLVRKMKLDAEIAWGKREYYESKRRSLRIWQSHRTIGKKYPKLADFI